jgi:hypothetical protein
MNVLRARGGGMDREILMDDLDLILERSRDELPGEWDWEPPLGTAVAISALEPGDAAVDGPDDEAEDDADNEEEEEEEEEEDE